MKKMIMTLFAAGILFTACAKKHENPFFNEWDTPFQTPPFGEIKNEHFKPAILEGIKLEKAEIDAIVNNSEEPTFENTIEALDATGMFLSRVQNVFNSLNGAHTNDELKKIREELIPVQTAHYNDINLNEELFARVKAVYEKREELNLDDQQKKLLTDRYNAFVRSGANLDETGKKRYREISEQLGLLYNNFGKNILDEVNKFELVIEKEEDLAGLPAGVIAAAASTAKAKGYEGKWVFTISKPSLLPFLTYSEKRDLREKMFKAYASQGDKNDELDNKEIIKKIIPLRLEKAKLLGFDTFADYALDNRMAKKPQKVYDLMLQLWKPALERAKGEVKDMQALIRKEGKRFKLEPWDWWYYAEKVKKEKYALDEAMLRPYFEVNNVREGAFYVANKLWGITFTERKDIPVYHPEVKVFEVKDADGSHIGILYGDYHPRESKRGGAWMSSYRKQYMKDAKNVTPLIYNVGNFTSPDENGVALISLDEAETLFHEFGHGLHGLLSKCKYYGQSGTSVQRDFVELPSQVMEHWAFEPEVLKVYAKHYETGEVIPDELIEKINKSGHFNQGFINVELLAATLLDMDWHTITEAGDIDVTEFENASMKKIGLIDEIIPRYRSTYFRHIFGSDGYSAGYYSYTWAAVLDSDAYAAFKETGDIFHAETAAKLRDLILSKGGTEDGMSLYKKYRGQEPTADALMKDRGLL